MNEVLRNIGRALDNFFNEIARAENKGLDVIDHGDPDAGRTYIYSASATKSTFDKTQRTMETFEVLTQIAPAEFWLEIEADAVAE